jgi:hypothetical protein
VRVTRVDVVVGLLLLLVYLALLWVARAWVPVVPY